MLKSNVKRLRKDWKKKEKQWEMWVNMWSDLKIQRRQSLKTKTQLLKILMSLFLQLTWRIRVTFYKFLQRVFQSLIKVLLSNQLCKLLNLQQNRIQQMRWIKNLSFLLIIMKFRFIRIFWSPLGRKLWNNYLLDELMNLTKQTFQWLIKNSYQN